jgi:hypothetical protein
LIQCAGFFKAADRIPCYLGRMLRYQRSSATPRILGALRALELVFGAGLLAGASACSAQGLGGVEVTGDAGENVKVDECSTERYVILDAGNASATYSMHCPGLGSGCDGSGLVLDKTTALVWMRFEYFPCDPDTLSVTNPGQTYDQAVEYCANRGMRLPTMSEALNIAGENTLQCVWQPYWATWTKLEVWAQVSSIARSDGSTLGTADGAPALCVRPATDGGS